MSALTLSVLGPLSFTLGDKLFDGFRIRRAVALCVYLACQPERHRRESLMALLWPDWSPASAQQNLRQNLYILRQTLPTVASHDGSPVSLILSDREALQLNPTAAVTVDALQFISMLEQPRPAPAHLAEAVALYRGDFLADFYLHDSEPFEEWAAARRADLRHRMQVALDILATGALEQNALGEAMAYARRQLELDNLNESAHRHLMLALAHGGYRTAALKHYETCRRLLREELGLEPSAETLTLVKRITAGDDLWDSQASIATKSSLTGAANEPVNKPRHNLPLQLSSFIGRERELAEIRRLLESSRLVTLTGAGGSGKTRLALEVTAGLVNEYADGVRFVELAPLSDPVLVASAVASSLGIVESEGRPLLDALVSYLRDRHLLLLLDNCEHLVAEVARLANALLHHCRQLRILATSREALGIAGEAAWLAPILSLPPPDKELSIKDLTQYDAIRLFVERATAALPTFTLSEDNTAAVIHLCRQLDAMPLAIELAAARVRLLRVEQIVARLDDRFRLLAGGSRTAPSRHQTLRASIDWSYDLLPPIEQRLLRRLSVFADGFTLEAAEVVCDIESEGDTLETLTQLANKSLVIADRTPGQEARYDLHETIRQYAWKELEAMSETGPMQERHAEYYCRLVEAMLSWYCFDDDRVILYQSRLETELENWRVALSRSLDDRAVSPELGIRLVLRLVGFWIAHDRMTEGRYWLNAALARAAEATISTRAALYVREADRKMFAGDPQALPLATEALALFRQVENTKGIIWATWVISAMENDLEQARFILEQCLAPATELGGEALGVVHYGIAWVGFRMRDYQLAFEHSEKALHVLRRLGAWVNQVRIWPNLAFIYISAGDYDRAGSLLLEALALARMVNPGSHFAGRVLNAFGEKARLQGDYDQAIVYYRECLALSRGVGDNLRIAIGLTNIGDALIAQGDLPQATDIFRESINLIRHERRTTAALLLNLQGFARLAGLGGEPIRAVRLHSAAKLLGQGAGDFQSPPDIADNHRSLIRAQEQLSETTFAAAWAEGQTMSLEEAIAYALEE